MSKKTKNHRNDHKKSSGNVGGFGEKTGVMSNQEYEYWKRNQSKNNAATVNRDAAHPFTQVIALRLKYEPFVPQVGYRDAEQAGEQ